MVNKEFFAALADLVKEKGDQRRGVYRNAEKRARVRV